MSRKWAYEIIHEEYTAWPGNALYADIEYAKFCAEQDFVDSFYDKWQAGYENADGPGYFSWEPIGKAYYHMYENTIPTGVALKVRPIHSAED